MKTNTLCVTLLTLLTLLGAVTASHATLLMYDGFNYSAAATVGTNSGNGLNGGTGWGTSTRWYDNQWTTTNSNLYTIASSGLSYGSLTTTGNALTQASDTIGAFRTFNNSNTTLADGTYYVSFLYSISGNSPSTSNQYAGLQIGQAYVGLATLGGTGTTSRVLEVGAGFATNTVSTGIAPVAGDTYLLVLKLDFTAAANGDTLSLWVNPTTSDESSAGTAQAINTAVSLTSLTSANFYASSNLFGMTVDELRIGTTWADVTAGLAVPEPETYALLLMSVFLLAIGVKRRSRHSDVI